MGVDAPVKAVYLQRTRRSSSTANSSLWIRLLHLRYSDEEIDFVSSHGGGSTMLRRRDGHRHSYTHAWAVLLPPLRALRHILDKHLANDLPAGRLPHGQDVESDRLRLTDQ